MTIQVESVVLCEDIRRENNGKQILIGVYGGSLKVPRLPYGVVLSWWIQVMPDPGKYEIDFRVMGPSDTQLIEGKLITNIKEKKRGVIALARTRVQLQKEGIIKLEWKTSHDADWQILKDIEVELQKSNWPHIEIIGETPT